MESNDNQIANQDEARRRRRRRKRSITFSHVRAVRKFDQKLSSRSKSQINVRVLAFFYVMFIPHQPHFYYIRNALSPWITCISMFFLCIRGMCAFGTTNQKFYGTFTIVFIRSIFLASIHSTATDRSFIQYVLYKSPSSWSVTQAHPEYFYEYQMARGIKTSLDSALSLLVEYTFYHITTFCTHKHAVKNILPWDFTRNVTSKL